MTENYQKEELTIDIGNANVVAIISYVVIAILFGLPFLYVWVNPLTIESYKQVFSSSYKWPVAFVVILVGIVGHELIHGITWAMFAKKGFKSISFGVAWKYLAPYCHCSEPLLVKHYILGGIMPGIILGVVPLLSALFLGNIQLFLFGMLFTGAASADFMIVNILRKEPMSCRVEDHPSKPGCYIYRPA